MIGGRIQRSVFALFFAGLLTQCMNPVQVGQKAPEFSLNGLDVPNAVLGELIGKVVILHFWATWCPPCLKELPELTGFFKNLKKKDVVLLPVCVDKTKAENVKKFLDSWGFDFPVYLDPGGRLARRYGTFRYPETYVLDPQGIIRRKVVGPGNWKSTEWAQFLQKISSEGKNPSPFSSS